MVLDFRSDLFEHCQKLSLTFHDARRTGELMGRINYQSASVGNVLMAFPPIFYSVLNLIGMFTISVLIEWRIAVMSLLVVPFLYYSAASTASASFHGSSACRGSSGSRSRSFTRRWRCCG